jgi:hypothetical protein
LLRVLLRSHADVPGMRDASCPRVAVELPGFLPGVPSGLVSRIQSTCLHVRAG